MNYLIVLQNELQAMARATVAGLPTILIAAVVLTITWFVARFAAGIARRIAGRTRLRSDLKDLLETLVRVAVWVVGFLLAATIAIPDFTFGGMVAGLGIGAVAIGFAFQDIFKNFLAGVLIMLREKMRIGDQIECEDIRGKVEHISLRETHVRQLSGELTIVPNSKLFEEPVQIITDQRERRDEFDIVIAYDSDLDAARAAIEAAARSVPTLAPDHPVEVFLRGVDSSAGGVELQLRWWTDAVANNTMAVRTNVIAAVIKALNAAGIELPTASSELVVPDETTFNKVAAG